MSVEVYLADGWAFSGAKQQKSIVNTWMNLQTFLQATCWGVWKPGFGLMMVNVLEKSD
jgi:hypothetical protein